MKKVKFRGLKLHPGQQRFRGLLRNEKHIDYYCMIVARGWGKSLSLVDYAYENCFENAGTEMWYTTPILDQSKKIWRMYVEPFVGTGFFKKVNLSDLLIYFHNGSTLQFRSVEKYENLRGAHLTDLICDEFDYYRPDAYVNALAPMMNQRGRRTIFSSTPNGKGQFYEFCKRGETESNWITFRSTIEETGIQKYIDNVRAQRGMIADALYRQEYEAEFIDEGGEVFTKAGNIFTLEDFAPKGKKHYGGIDIGKGNDRTVITILNEKGECVFWKRFSVEEQNDGVVLAEHICTILNQFPNLLCLWETNFDPSVFDMAKRKVKGLIKHHTSNETKNNIVSRLNASINKGTIFLPRFAIEIREELLNYQMNHTPTKKLPSYSAPSGRHDDCVISLALANYIYCNYQKL